MADQQYPYSLWGTHPQLCTQTHLYRSVHHLSMQSSNTQMPKVTHMDPRVRWEVRHMPPTETHTHNHTHAHTRQWRGQWPQGTQSQGEAGTSDGPRFTEFDTDSVGTSLKRGFHRPSLETFKYKYCGDACPHSALQ